MHTTYLPLLSFGWPTIAVDTHIDRVSNRTKFAMGKNVVEVEKKLLKVVPAKFKVDVHHWLILRGSYTESVTGSHCSKPSISPIDVEVSPNTLTYRWTINANGILRTSHNRWLRLR